ncbi:MAG TPA: NAD-dependent epimerase/dehydratase family protein [Gemmatimonadales bacterium]|nr:NAD-dependent epimerase/dehydratase family protein [Gemmatimonadales bacterium]
MTSKSTRCLVTGGAGFIGSHIVQRLRAEGHDVRVIDNLSTGTRENLAGMPGVDFIEGDIREAAACDRAVAGIEVIFHVAALPSVPRSIADPWASHDHNVNGTVQLLEAARRAGVRRVVYSSSSSVYGDTPTLPKIETMEPLCRSPYATAKLAGEQYVLAYARAGMLEGVALRYFNVFGPRQSPRSAYAAVIPAFLDCAQKGSVAHVNGDGEQTRDFTYVENVVQANCLAAFGPSEQVNGWVTNAGAGNRTSLNELLSLVEQVTGRPVAREYQAPRAGDVRDSQASLDRARKVLGYVPGVGLEEGLRRTWAWFVEETAAPVQAAH